MTDLAKEFAPAGTLRASLNMGNPVLAHSHTATEKPAGVTIDLSREFAHELGVAVDFLQFDTAAKSVAALASGEADIGFMAIDPLRAETTHFTPAYVQIEAYYLVPGGSPIQTNTDVDRAGTRIVMGAGSAYGLYLQRHIQHATLVPVPTSEAVVDAMLKDGMEVSAGVKQGLEADAHRVGGVRLLGERFMVINQAMAMPRARSAAAAAFLDDFVARMKRSGFVAASLARHAIVGATVADH
ncbi:MAG: transporter substrate-binding domain-containing protein [Polaromonas sp.]|uniref:transporter substrate-binding domain-containing protein n=1 Tax=Polaromonas sp. TaxID=1869339 RepID=UPI00273690B2|nr:transporter substrate-binding domain-containing protein [Polaromonas sp.]MDP2817940.1 transporter substrate-binding domain-containing protein [Polaromonas sp.]